MGFGVNLIGGLLELILILIGYLYSSVYCTAVFIVQQCLLYSRVYCTAVFIEQQCLLYSGVYCTAVIIVQQCLL